MEKLENRVTRRIHVENDGGGGWVARLDEKTRRTGNAMRVISVEKNRGDVCAGGGRGESE